jgi:hypothetical protein
MTTYTITITEERRVAYQTALLAFAAFIQSNNPGNADADTAARFYTGLASELICGRITPDQPQQPERDFDKQLEKFLATVNELKRSYCEQNFPSSYARGHFEQVSAMRGSKYVRIVEQSPGHRAVYCFVDYQGNIYKSASWRAPAKHVRGSIWDENCSVGKGVGVYGAAYLR